MFVLCENICRHKEIFLIIVCDTIKIFQYYIVTDKLIEYDRRSMEVPIHPTAIISPQAKIDPSNEIGPYVIVEGEVTIGANNKIFPHVYIGPYTEIGSNNEIHTGAVLGDTPQDLAFDPATVSYLKIGDNNVIREFASIHRGTAPKSETIIGNNCFIMGYSHIGHNCQIDDDVKIANMAALSGYVQVGKGTFVSGYSLIHQFVRIGKLCMIAGGTRLGMDLPHFMMAQGESAVIGVNRIGMKRAGYSSDEITNVRSAYRLLWRSGMLFRKALEKLESENQSDVVAEVIEFIKSPSRRGIAGPPDKNEDKTKE